jgi:phenylpropionate dioxygenase-like ring-hydroxylating dioxygenase large terminal subunit
VEFATIPNLKDPVKAAKSWWRPEGRRLKDGASDLAHCRKKLSSRRNAMNEAKPFPLNAWYAAAWSHEIKHELAARTICDKDVVLYRRTDSVVVALEDACWHRLLPLSLGRIKDDQVVCGYHGLVGRFHGSNRMPTKIGPSGCSCEMPVTRKL